MPYHSKSPRRNRSRPRSRSTVRIPIDKTHYLSEHGYTDVKNKTSRQRRIALGKVVRRSKKGVRPVDVFRSLIARSTVNKNRDKKLAAIFRSDAYWVKDTFMKPAGHKLK